MFYQSECLLSLCSRSCLHSALIDEAVATFTLIEARGKKSFQPLYLSPGFFSSPTPCALYVSIYFTNVVFFFYPLVKFNKLLCCQVCIRLPATAFFPHYVSLSAVILPLSTLFRVFLFPQVCLAVVKSLHPQDYLSCT